MDRHQPHHLLHHGRGDGQVRFPLPAALHGRRKSTYARSASCRVNTSWIWNPNYTRGYSARLVRAPAPPTEPYAGEGNYHAGNILAGEVNYLATSKLILSFRGGYNYNNHDYQLRAASYTAIYYSGRSPQHCLPRISRLPNGWIQNPGIDEIRHLHAVKLQRRRQLHVQLAASTV